MTREEVTAYVLARQEASPPPPLRDSQIVQLRGLLQGVTVKAERRAA